MQAQRAEEPCGRAFELLTASFALAADHGGKVTAASAIAVTMVHLCGASAATQFVQWLAQHGLPDVALSWASQTSSPATSEEGVARALLAYWGPWDAKVLDWMQYTA
jgi:hypothetical protein